MSRRDGVAVARWVADRVQEVAPPGLGRWGPAWDMVALPSLEFLDALARWEATGSEDDREAARVAAGAVVSAWRKAAQEWENAGRPVEPLTPQWAKTVEAIR